MSDTVKPKNEKWVLAVHNSDDDADIFTGIMGTVGDVIAKIHELIDEDADNYKSEKGYDEDDVIPEGEIMVDVPEATSDATAYGCVIFDSYHIDYTAVKVSSLFSDQRNRMDIS